MLYTVICAERYLLPRGLVHATVDRGPFLAVHVALQVNAAKYNVNNYSSTAASICYKYNLFRLHGFRSFSFDLTMGSILIILFIIQWMLQIITHIYSQGYQTRFVAPCF